MAACQASLSLTIPWSLPKFISIVPVMPSSYLILWRPLLLLLSIFPSFRDLSKELAVCIRWPKYWSFSISPSKEYSGLISIKIDWFDLFAVQGTLKGLLLSLKALSKVLLFFCQHILKTLIRPSAFFVVQLSHPYMTTGKPIALTIEILSTKWCLCFLICCLVHHDFPSKE